MVFIYSAVGFLFWQHTNQLVADLETELRALNSKFQETNAQRAAEFSSSDGMEAPRHRAAKPQWLDVIESFEAYGQLTHGNSQSIKPQWRAVIDALKNYQTLWEEHKFLAQKYEAHWSLPKRTTQQHDSIEQLSLNLTLIPEGQAVLNLNLSSSPSVYGAKSVAISPNGAARSPTCTTAKSATFAIRQRSMGLC